MEIPFRVALAQYLSDCDPEVVVTEAKNQGADVVVFPEMYSNGHAWFDPQDALARERWRRGAHQCDDGFIEQFRTAARACQIFVVATLLESGEPNPYNSALLIDTNGRTILHHRKVHVADFDSPESACERGSQFGVAEIRTTLGSTTVGLMICMDREFPAAGISLSRAGAEIVLVPNCCTLATDPAVGDVRIAQTRGRAFETVMGIAVANYPAPRCDGHSFATDPRGRIIAMADDSSGLTIATFDLADIRRQRTEDSFRWCP